MDTRQELERRLQIATSRMHVAYNMRDRAILDGKEQLARSLDMAACDYDLQRVRLQNQLEAAN